MALQESLVRVAVGLALEIRGQMVATIGLAAVQESQASQDLGRDLVQESRANLGRDLDLEILGVMTGRAAVQGSQASQDLGRDLVQESRANLGQDLAVQESQAKELALLGKDGTMVVTNGTEAAQVNQARAVRLAADPIFHQQLPHSNPCHSKRITQIVERQDEY